MATENPTQPTLLEDIRDCEKIFMDYTLAFDIACILAEAGDDGEFMSLKELTKLLDPHLSYGCETKKQLQDLVKEIIASFNERYVQHGFMIIKNKKNGYKLAATDEKEKKAQQKLTESKKRPPRKSRGRKLLIPKSTLTTKITAITKKKIDLTLPYVKLEEEKEKPTAGHVLRDVLRSNYPKGIKKIAEQIRKELGKISLPTQVRNKRIVINKPPGVAEIIYQIANELQVTIPTVIECLAYYLPLLEEKGGRRAWVQILR